MNHRIDIDVESDTYTGIIDKIKDQAREFFGDDDFDYSFSATKAPNLNVWQAEASAWKSPPKAPPFPRGRTDRTGPK